MSMSTLPSDFPDTEQEFQGSGRLVLAGGCFWCTEAVFQLLEGVESVEPGYTGGSADSANYHAVCSGITGHAEAIEIHYNPAVISFGQLLKVFFAVSHDPTQLNGQGADEGTQYRSAIFYETEEERQFAAAYIQQLDAAGIFPAPIVTSLEPLDTFFPAEQYHHDYAQRNPHQPYICAVSDPKVAKLKQAFPALLKARTGAN